MNRYNLQETNRRLQGTFGNQKEANRNLQNPPTGLLEQQDGLNAHSQTILCAQFSLAFHKETYRTYRNPTETYKKLTYKTPIEGYKKPMETEQKPIQIAETPNQVT